MLVHFGVPVLAHHDDGGLERGDKGQDQVEQDKRRPAEMGGKTDYVPQHPQNQKGGEDDDEAPTAAESGYLVGQAVREAGVPDIVGVETMDDLLVVLLHQIIDFFVNLDPSRVGGTGNFARIATVITETAARMPLGFKHWKESRHRRQPAMIPARTASH